MTFLILSSARPVFYSQCVLSCCRLCNFFYPNALFLYVTVSAASVSGGHAEVVHLLVNARADVDSQDNRKVSCLMAAFRKGHVKVVKWLVKHVTQFPSDQECVRYIATVTDKVSLMNASTYSILLFFFLLLIEYCSYTTHCTS